MKKYLLTAALVCYACCAFPQSSIDGKYYGGPTGSYIKIERSRFSIREKMVIAGYPEILTEGTITEVGDFFIELNTEPDPEPLVWRNIKIEDEYRSDIPDDEVVIEFVFPDEDKPLFLISVTIDDYDNNWRSEQFSTLDNNRIILPRDAKYFSFTIRPLHYLLYNSERFFCGYVDVLHSSVYIWPAFNYFKVTAPYLNNLYFQQYFVKGEYARITEEGIIWRGDTYKKISDDPDYVY